MMYADERERKRAMRLCMALDMALETLGIPEPFGVTHEFPSASVPSHKMAVKSQGRIARVTIDGIEAEPTAEWAAQTADRLYRAWFEAS